MRRIVLTASHCIQLREPYWGLTLLDALQPWFGTNGRAIQIDYRFVICIWIRGKKWQIYNVFISIYKYNILRLDLFHVVAHKSATTTTTTYRSQTCLDNRPRQGCPSGPVDHRQSPTSHTCRPIICDSNESISMLVFNLHSDNNVFMIIMRLFARTPITSVHRVAR